MISEELKIHQVRNQAIDFLREEDIYLINIHIYVGVSQRQIKWEHLGLRPQVIDRLKKSNASPPCLKVFKTLQDCGTKLRTFRAQIQRRFMIHAEPMWFVKESSVKDFYAEYKSLQQTCEEYRTEILASYDTELYAFLLNIKDVLISAGVDKGLDNTIALYKSYFPTKEYIKERFGVMLEGPLVVPSLKKQSLLDSELASSEHKYEEATLIKELQNQYYGTINQKLNEALEAAKEEFYELISDSIVKIEDAIKNDKITNKRKDMLDNTIERLMTLVNFDTNLSDILGQFKSLALNTQSEDFNTASNKLKELKQSLHSELDSIITYDKEGHKSLAAWIMS